MTGFGLKAGASALALALAALASPAAAQERVIVEYDFPVNPLRTPTPTTGVIIRERNVDESLPPPLDLMALNLEEAQQFADSLNRFWRFQPLVEGGPLVDTGCTLVPWEVTGGTTVRFNPAIVDARNGRPECIFEDFSFKGAVTGPGSYEHRIFAQDVIALIDNTNGNPGEVSLSGTLVDGDVATFSGTSLAVARTALLLAANSAARYRYFAGEAVRTGGGPVISTDRIISERISGRDTVAGGTFTTATPQISDPFVIVGTRTNCPTANSAVGCQGGVRIENFGVAEIFAAHVFTTLYITQSVERTLTGGTTFFDVPLTPLPSGAVHALAAQGALGGGQRFLDRLGDHAALVDRRGLWGEIAGSRLRFDATGPLAPSAADGMAARLGFDLAAAPGLTLGLAGEYASDDLAITDPITPESGTLTRWSLGAHARLDRGRLTASLAAQVGSASIDTSGASDLGAARAEYDATTYGIAGRIGVSLGTGPLTLTPEVGASWNRWERDGFAEEDGPAPLTVLAAADEQTRLWAGGRLAWQGGSLRRRVTLTTYGRVVQVGGDRTPAITAIDPQLPDLPMTVFGPQLDETRGEYGASASLGLGQSGSLRIGWDAASDGNLDSHAVTATLLIAL